MHKYSFVGAVYTFHSDCVDEKWRGETYAPSKAKAISNLKYRFRKENNLQMYTPIDFDGDWCIA